MDIVESINRYLAGSPVNKGERTRLTRARDEIMRLRTSSQPAQQEPVAWVDEATHYQPQQKAFYKRVSATEWYVWSRIEQEPLHWCRSLGTSDGAHWILRHPARHDNSDDLTIAYTAGLARGKELALAEQPAQQEPVAHPFEDKAVISSLSWAAGLIEQAYRDCGGHNGADSWLMNYADKQGERIRQADRREWEKVNGRWQVKANPPQRKPLTDEKVSDQQCRRLLYGFMLDFNAVGFEQAGRNLHRAMKEAAHGIKENT